ncbi:unnamed protein product, partial [Ixodes hexagonus]
MRPCLVLLVALCVCTVEAARNVPGPSAMLRRSLWWRPTMARRQARAGGASASLSTPAKGSSEPGHGAGAKPGPKVGAPEESPGEVSHDGAAAKGQQSVRFPRGARQYDVPQIGEL